MSDRGPFDPRDDQQPTEYFPPLRDGPPVDRPGASDLPPIGADRDPEPTRVVPTWDDAEPTTVLPPSAPGGGGGPGGGGPYDPYDPYEEEPEPWYRQRGPLLALGAGLLALILAIVALVVLTGGDDDGDADVSLPSVPTTTSTVPPTTDQPTTLPSTTTSTTTTLPPTTTSSSTTTTTTSTTTTTLPPTTEPPPPTTPPPPPEPESAWDVIQRSPGLGQLEQAIVDTDLVDDFAADGITVLAPTDDAFDDLRASVGGEDLLDDTEQLRQVLLRHIVPGVLTVDDLFAQDELPTAQGEPLTVDADARTIEGASVLQTVEPTGGASILHSVDLVIT